MSTQQEAVGAMVAGAELAEAVSEGAKAWKWREARGLSRAELGALIGWSESQIQNIEHGVTRSRETPIPARIRQRYRASCAVLHNKITFDWELGGDA